MQASLPDSAITSTEPIVPMPALAGHRLGLLCGGEQLFPALVDAIDAATRSVHLETYILHFEGQPLGVVQALARAARRGVGVRLVVDGVGTGSLPDAWRQVLTEAGVQWRVFAPLGRWGLAIPSRWRRLHRKLCVVDGVLGFCGGINLLDDRLQIPSGRLAAPRFDFALCCTGPLVGWMQAAVDQLWGRMDAVRQVQRRAFRDALHSWLAHTAVTGPPQPAWLDAWWARTHRGQEVGDAVARLVLRDNVRHRVDIERTYLNAVRQAREEILMAHAYFVPGRRLRRALSAAAQRGVRVRVLLQGRYEGFMQHHAARPIYRSLLDAGVELGEYTPSDLHAKVAVIDGQWVTIGSSNLDPLSLLLAREANIVSTDRQLAGELRQRLVWAWAQASRPLDHPALIQRPWHQRGLDQAAYALMRLAIFLSGHRY